jgi:hypothetical protein
MKISRPDVVAVRAFYKRRTPATGVVTSSLALDLDHVGTEIGQHLTGPGSGQYAGKFEDAEARQWLRHVWKLPEGCGMSSDAGGYKVIGAYWP